MFKALGKCDVAAHKREACITGRVAAKLGNAWLAGQQVGANRAHQEENEQVSCLVNSICK